MENLFQIASLDFGNWTTEKIAYGILAIFYIFAEIWCIISTIRTFYNPLLRTEISLVVFYLSLHLTLILRLINLLNEIFENFPANVKNALDDGTVIAKDIFVLSLTCRILEAVYAGEPQNEYIRKLISAIYIFAGIHTVAFTALFILVVISKIQSTTLAIYTASAQGIIIAMYIFSFVKFILLWKRIADESNLDRSEEDKGNEYLKRLLIIMIYVILMFMVRVLVNVGEFFGWEESLKNNNVPLLLAYTIPAWIITELIPCSLMNWYLYTISSQMSQAQEQIEQVSQGSTPIQKLVYHDSEESVS